MFPVEQGGSFLQITVRYIAAERPAGCWRHTWLIRVLASRAQRALAGLPGWGAGRFAGVEGGAHELG
jgi:hypothetical protein